MAKYKWILSLMPIYLLILVGIVSFAYFANQAADVFSQRSETSGSLTLIIDPGHGGEDGGATSCTGVLESTFNLQIAQRVNDLVRLLGGKTKMIRTEDVSIYSYGNTIAQKKISDLKERVRLVNETENCVLISIHQNYFSDSRYKGPQVFYGKTGSGEDFARQMQQDLNRNTAAENTRKQKPADNIYLLSHIKKTGILIECGFLSNYDEEARLRSEEYQKRLSGIIACSYMSFFDP